MRITLYHSVHSFLLYIKQTQINYIYINYSYEDVSREFHQSMKIVKKKKVLEEKKTISAKSDYSDVF
jgi:hypothetical protein